MEAAKELARHNHELFVSVVVQPQMSVQRALLFAYDGLRVILRFSSEIALTSDDIHFNWYKNMEVRSFVDDAGQIWRDVVAENDIDWWLSRPERE